MVTTQVQTGAAAEPGSPWGRAPYPVLVVDPRGAVALRNEAAAVLLPAAGPGSRFADVVPFWLAAAHDAVRAAGAGTGALVSGTIGERAFEAHPNVQDGGAVAWWLVDDTDHRLVREALVAERQRTALLAEASSLLLSSLNLGRCMDVTAQTAADNLADAALVIAPPSGQRLPMVACLRGGTPSQSQEPVDPHEVPGLGEALRGFPPVPSRWIDPSVAPGWIVPVGFGPVGSIVITPLPGHGVPAGALVLLRTERSAAFTESEEVFARLFAARAGAAMSAARLYTEQSQITEILMRELLPPTLHQVTGVDFAGGYRASMDRDRIGGDFYDVHPAAAEGEASLVALGDVCGKGLEAAVLTGKIRNTLHALLPLADDHQRILSLLNTALLTSHHTRFATLVLASAERTDDGVSLRLTSAGHPHPLIVRADGEVEQADTRGTLVGVLPEAPARTTAATLAPGEACVLYTDGITEARGGPLGDTLFGENRLARALSECAGMPAESIVERVQMLASQWVGNGSHDDMAVVVISAPRTPHPAPERIRRTHPEQVPLMSTQAPDRPAGTPAVHRLADLLWEAVAAADEYSATDVVLSALDDGVAPERVLLEVIAPVQGRVGREWAANRVSVAGEHAATAINERAVAALSVHPATRTTPHRGRLTVACVDGEWHALPARLLAEVLKLRGWQVDYLGAQVPAPHLISHLHRTGPDAVALSSSIATRLPTAHAALTACQAIGVPVMVGGAAFGPDGRYARLLGADAWAPHARAAADRLARGRLERPRPDHQQMDDLPHLADQEYTMVARNSTSLVRTVFTALEDAFPAMRGYTDQQREHTAEDLGHIVDFLATTLYLGDEDLFTGFLTWTADILTARGVPARSLPPALTILARELKDFPRATRVLRSGREILAGAGAPA